MIKKRLNYIDIAKAFAIFYIILGHTIVHSKNSYLVLQFVCSFHVVLFFILSGFTFKINTSFSQFVKKKFWRIVLPYLVWAMLFLIPYYILGKSAGEDLGTTQSFDFLIMLKNILYANGNNAALKQNSSLWFLPALFTIEIVYYFIIKLTKSNVKKEIITLSILIIIGYIFSKYCEFILPWGINTLVNLGFFFYIGYLSNEYNILEKFNIKSTMIVCLVIGLFCCYFGNKIHLSYIDFYYGNYIFMILSGVFLSFFTICLSKCINKNGILEYIGKNTMAILIFHKLFVIIFQTKCGIVSKYIMNSNIIVETLLATIVGIFSIFCSLFIASIIKKTLPILLGEKIKKEN